MTNKLRVQGTTSLMSAAREAGASRVVAQSASFMTQPLGTGPTDESSPVYLEAPEPLHSHALANVSAEALVVGTPGVEGMLLRYGFLYGAGPQVEWVPYLAELLEAPAPRHVPEEKAAAELGIQAVYYSNQLRAASNAKAKAELGLTLEYPSWREGFRDVFA